MSEFLLTLFIGAAALAVAFILLVVGIIKGRGMLLILAGVLFLAGVGVGVYGLVQGASRASTVVREEVQKHRQRRMHRSAREVYESFFGAPPHDCVRVLDYVDAVVPVVDSEVWLEFATCPAEVRRVLARPTFPVLRPDELMRHERPGQLPASLRGRNDLLWFSHKDRDHRSVFVLTPDSTHGYFRDERL